MLGLSDKWAVVLVPQPETGMDYQIATVTLNDGRRLPQTTIVGGYITQIGGSSEIPFKEADIESIIVDHGR
jgi:hypothetical protein